MKKIYYHISILIIISQFFGFFALAKSNSINNLKIDVLSDGRALLSFSSQLDSRSTVYFGLKKDELNWQIGNLDYKRRHEVVLSGLRKDEDYYYKIVLRDSSGRSIESFINYFNTKDMVFTSPPEIRNFSLLQVIDSSAFFSFNTNREVRYEFYYSDDIDNLNRRVTNRRFLSNHKILINRHLKPNTNYYYRLDIYDRDNNLRSKTGRFKTRSADFSQIKINNLMPSHSQEMPMMAERAIISWQTNILSTSEIYYGEDPQRLRTRVRVSESPSFNHYIVLENLKADTQYYFQIRLRSSLNNASLNSQVYSFKTAPLSHDYLSQHFQSGDLVNHRRNTYIIFEDKKVPIYNSEKINQLKEYQEIKSINDIYLEKYESINPYHGVFFDGQVIKEERSNTVYVIDGKYRRPIANYLVFQYLNYQASDIKIASRDQIRAYSLGDIITHSHQLTGASYGALYNNSLVKTRNSNTVYLIVNNQRLPIFDEKSFNLHGFNFSDVKIIDDRILNSFPLGQLII